MYYVTPIYKYNAATEHPVLLAGLWRGEIETIVVIMLADRCHHHTITLQHRLDTSKHPVCIDFSQVVLSNVRSDPGRIVPLLTDSLSINHYNP